MNSVLIDVIKEELAERDINIYIHWRDDEVHQAAEWIQILQKPSKSGK